MLRAGVLRLPAHSRSRLREALASEGVGRRAKAAHVSAGEKPKWSLSRYNVFRTIRGTASVTVADSTLSIWVVSPEKTCR